MNPGNKGNKHWAFTEHSILIVLEYQKLLCASWHFISRYCYSSDFQNYSKPPSLHTEAK